MSKNEAELIKELEEMFARENEELDKSHEKTVETHEKIMQMINRAKKPSGKLTDKQWIIATGKIMPHLEALEKISEDLGTGLMIGINIEGTTDVSCFKNDYGMHIYPDNTCSIRKNFFETLKEFRR